VTLDSAGTAESAVTPVTGGDGSAAAVRADSAAADELTPTAGVDPQRSVATVRFEVTRRELLQD
jgi:hypothetical protein